MHVSVGILDFSLREMDQKFPFAALIGCGNSCLDSILCYSKVFRLHAISHYASGAVRSHTGKGPGYCYIIGQSPNSCLLSHVTELLLCLNVKIFVPSIFNFVDFGNNMSVIVLDIELTEKKVIKGLGLFIDGSLRGYSFCPPKTYKATKESTWNTSHLHGIAWSSGKLDYVKLFSVFYDIKVMNAEGFAKGLEKCRLFTRPLGQNLENLHDYGSPKIQILVETHSSWICSSYPFRQKTRLYCAKRKAKFYGELALRHSQILYKFFLFVFTTHLYLSTGQDFFL